MAYADKRAGQRLESMAARFALVGPALSRTPGTGRRRAGPSVGPSGSRRDVCRAAGVAPDGRPPAGLDRSGAPGRAAG